MTAISANQLGVFAVQDGKVIAFERFPADPKEILSRLERLCRGEEIKELETLLAKLKKKGAANIFTEFPVKRPGLTVLEENEARMLLRHHGREIAKNLHLVKSDVEFNEIISSVALEKTRQEIKKSVGLDLVAIQVVGALDDLRDITNRFAERLREWYGLYYPELQIKDNERYAKNVAEYGKREKIPGFAGSVGVDMKKEDLVALVCWAKQTKDVFDLRKKTEEYLANLMNKIAPNITSLVGAYLAAKLLAHVGSLAKLAKLPASTIQLLGAEKALFRHMHLKRAHKKTRPPKYGIIFNHPAVQAARDELRGKVARLIASKLALAARTDFYVKKLKPEYKKELDEKLKEILGEK